MSKNPKSLTEFNVPINKSVKFSEQEPTNNQSQSGYYRQHSNKKQGTVKIPKSSILALALVKIAKIKLIQSLQKMASYKHSRFSLQLTKSKGLRNLKIGFLKIYSCYIEVKEKQIKNISGSKANLRLMFSVFNGIMKRRNKFTFRKIINYSMRKQQISGFVGILDQHMKRVDADHNIRPFFMKLQMQSLRITQITNKLKNIPLIFSKVTHRYKEVAFQEMINRISQKLYEQIKIAKVQLTQKIKEKNSSRNQALMSEKERLKNAKFTLDHNSSMRNKEKYQSKKEMSSIYIKSTEQSKRNEKSIKELTIQVKSKQNIIQLLTEGCMRRRKQLKQALNWQQNTTKIYKQIQQLKQMNKGLVELPKGLTNDIKKIKSVNEYHLTKSEILKRQISFYEDRMVKEGGNSAVQVENRVLKELISTFIQRIYEEEDFSKEVNAI